MENSKKTMDKIVALCKNRGFVYPGSEIYGGLANTWDYGPLGVALAHKKDTGHVQQQDRRSKTKQLFYHVAEKLISKDQQRNNINYCSLQN